jgi:hypothetical protein
MMQFDLSKPGVTTHFSCGTLADGQHYAMAEMGQIENKVAQDMFNALSKYAPTPPAENLKLKAIEVTDYKSFHNHKLYKVHILCVFRDDITHEKYQIKVDLLPDQVHAIYKLFSTTEGLCK